MCVARIFSTISSPLYVVFCFMPYSQCFCIFFWKIDFSISQNKVILIYIQHVKQQHNEQEKDLVIKTYEEKILIEKNRWGEREERRQQQQNNKKKKLKKKNWIKSFIKFKFYSCMNNQKFSVSFFCQRFIVRKCWLWKLIWNFHKN